MNIKDAMASGGALMTGAALLIGTFIGDTAHPYDRAYDQVAPSSPAVEERICPDGWDATSVTDHVFLQTCARGGWVVVLLPDGSADYGLNTADPSAAPVEPDEVPGWE